MAGKNLFVKVMFFRSITDLQTILIYENDVDVLKELVLYDDLRSNHVFSPAKLRRVGVP